MDAPRQRIVAPLLALALLPATSLASAAEPVQLSSATAQHADELIRTGLSYLAATQQPDGGWEAFGQSHPAISALVIKALAQDRRFGPNHPAVKRGLAYLLTYAQRDGGIYDPNQGMPNYHTSVALLALSATDDPAYRPAITRARTFLRNLQWDENDGYGPSDAWYGGQGYGQHKRPDLSNTQLMLEALHQSGLSPDDPVYRKALVFVSRCQMLGETNDQAFAAGSDDGGFIYTCANDGESKAGVETVDGEQRLRTYGSMTYAGFKSLLYAQVARDDVRVRRAFDWIRHHYTLQQNPSLPPDQARQGLYYYYHTFARALDAWGEPTITDAAGQDHDWRAELIDELAKRQRPDGSWVNDADRWYEGNPHLVTAYAVLAVQTAAAEGKRQQATGSE